MKRTAKELWDAVGGLSNASKMPGWSFGTSAEDCPIGSILRPIKGSGCNGCYALKGMYIFPVVRKAHANRMKILLADIITWQENMTELIRYKYRNKIGDDRVFRWHDSGDLQGVEHLSAIVAIAESLPDIRFWLPTKEYGLIRAWEWYFPANLAVRVSAPMIGAEMVPIEGTVSSTIDSGKGFECTSTLDANGQVLPTGHPDKGKCRECRACWDNSVLSVDYHLH